MKTIQVRVDRFAYLMVQAASADEVYDAIAQETDMILTNNWLEFDDVCEIEEVTDTDGIDFFVDEDELLQVTEPREVPA